jgi:hypothetical protein
VRALLVPVIGLGLAGCAVRAAPYRFASPLVGVSLEERAPAPPPRTFDDAVRPGDRQESVAVAELPGPQVPAAAGELPAGTRTEISDLLSDATAGAVVISRLPEPHREARAKPGEVRISFDGLDDADDLRALVGRRDGRTDVAFAIACAQILGEGTLSPPEDGPALVELARARHALVAPTEARPAPGDLLIFDRAVDDAPASRVAVVLTRDDVRGVVEMLYLARGVIRRGFVDVARPRTRRDADGRIVNTFLRHSSDQPPKGTRFLAGELLAHVVRWDLLR